MKNKWLTVVLIVVILALVCGLVFCGIKIKDLNAQINESTNTQVEQSEPQEETTQEAVETTKDTGLTLNEILSFNESQVKNLKDGQHIFRNAVDSCQYVWINVSDRNMKEFTAVVNPEKVKEYMLKDVPYAHYTITTPKEVSKIVCCEFGQSIGNDVYVFLYTDGTADYISADSILNGNLDLKHFEMDNIMDIFNIGVGYENAGGYVASLVVKYDGTAYILKHNDGVLTAE